MHSQVLRRMGYHRQHPSWSLQAEVQRQLPHSWGSPVQEVPLALPGCCVSTQCRTVQGILSYLLVKSCPNWHPGKHQDQVTHDKQQQKKNQLFRACLLSKDKASPISPNTSMLLIIPMSVQGLSAAPHTDFVSVFRAKSPECTLFCVQMVQSCIFFTLISNYI